MEDANTNDSRQTESAIVVNNIVKSFRLPHDKQNTIKGLFVSAFRSKQTYEKQIVLKGVSFEVKEGEFFGIVGRNGSGKSTLLKLLAGIYSPDSGHIQVNGKLTPFIELGVGFSPELTGRENIFLNGALLGFSRKEMLSMYDEIVEFAELEKFMDQKLKNYSSGMQVRLAFSIAIRAQSKILLLDEVLAVGDVLFQQKCFDYFGKLKRDKKTVLLVSHDVNVLRQFCTNGVLIESGQLVSSGGIDKILDEYIKIVSKKEAEANEKNANEKTQRVGSGKVVIRSLELKDKADKKKSVFVDSDDKLVITMNCESKGDVASPVYGITILDRSNAQIFATNTSWANLTSNDLAIGDRQTITWTIPNIFKTGSYIISPAVANSHGKEVYDSNTALVSFKVRKGTETTALTSPNYTTNISKVHSE